MNKPITCIICPKGCLITVNAQTSPWITEGNACGRGATYAIQETSDPRRTLTATVAIRGAAIPRCPVVTSAPMPKGELLSAIDKLYHLTIQAPVTAGEILVENFAGEGIHLLATRTLENTHAS